MTEVTPRLTAASVKFYWLNDLIGGAVDVTTGPELAVIAGEVQLSADPLQFVGIHFHGHAAHDQLQRKHNS